MERITDRLNNFMQLQKPQNRLINEQADNAQKSTVAKQGLLPDIVNISEEGKYQAANEADEKSLWQDLHKLATNQQNEAKAAEEDPKQDAIDAAIKKLEKEIRELQERIEPLKQKEDEASKEQLKQLEAQLMAFNIQLMELNNKKLEQLKADRA